MALGLTPYQIIEKGTHPQLVIADDWERIELKKIATVQNGYAFSSKLFDRTEGISLIRIRDIFSSETENQYLGEYKEAFVVNKGDILIGMDGDFKVSKWPGSRGLLNQRVCRINFNSSYYEKEFLFICIQPYLNAIHSETSAVTVKHLSSRTINDIPFPLPPLPIQRAIVAKIEELFSALDKGIADLKKAQAQLKIYRQAVLKKAFEGELTKVWRDTNKKIIYDWTNVNLSDISDSCLGKMLDKAKNKGLLKPYLGNINVRWGKFNTDSLKTMRIEDSEHIRFQLIKGDLVICEGGEPGRCAVWQNDESIFIQKALHRVRFKTNCNPYYFYYYFFYQAQVGGLDAYFTGTTIKHLTGRKLKEFKVPFRAIEEQHQIVQEIESRLSVCDKVEQSIAESLEKAKALRQSILKKAFDGSLLSAAEIAACKAAPDYEPASVLLEKIKAEKSKK